MSNYRPISVLPVIAKLLKKLIANQLYQHMNDNVNHMNGLNPTSPIMSNLLHSTKSKLVHSSVPVDLALIIFFPSQQ